MAIIPGMQNIDFTSVIAQTVYWGGYVLLGIVIIGIMFLIWNYAAFTIKATVYPLYGSGKDGIFSIGKPKNNKIKWMDKKTAWKSLMPLFNKIKRQPFDPEYIYPGKRVFIFELGDQWIPGRVNISKVSEDEIRVNIDPIPSYLRNWELIVHKQIDQELQSEDFWAKNKEFITTLSVIVFCLILCGATIWFTYKYAGGGRASMDALTSAIKGITDIGGGGLAPR